MSFKSLAKKVFEEVKDKTPAEDFGYQLTRLIQQVEADSAMLKGWGKKTGRRLSLSPSSIGNCARNLWYSYRVGELLESQQIDAKALEESVKPDTVVTATVGTMTHNAVQGWLKRMSADPGYIFDYIDVKDYLATLQARGIGTEFIGRYGNEVKWENNDYGIPIRGLADGVINFNNRLYLLEIKSTDPTGFGNIHNTRQPKPAHREQAIISCMVLGLPAVMFLYIDRGFGKREALVYEVTVEDIREVVERIEFLSKALPSEELPAPEGPRCPRSYCKFKTLCRKNGDCPV